MSEVVQVSVDGPVATVTLNRPDKQNAVDGRMFDALAAAADGIADNTSIRAVVLHGAGKSFCAGIDLGFFGAADERLVASLGQAMAASPANRFQRAALAWRELPIPVVAAVHGVCFGAGLQIALGADLRFASVDAKFSIMESSWGLVPDMGLSVTARGLVRPDRLRELAYTGRVVTSAEALDYGLVTALEEDPYRSAQQLAAVLSTRSPDAIRGIKQLVDGIWEFDVEGLLRREARLQAEVLGKPNQREAVMSNIEHRDAKFTDPAT